MDVENLTCTGGRRLAVIREELENGRRCHVPGLCGCTSFPDALLPYEQQHPKKPAVYGSEPEGIIYHTIKFCDYYGFEYASIKRDIKVPLLKIETDFTSQSAGQLLTRVQAFAETLEGSEDMDHQKELARR